MKVKCPLCHSDMSSDYFLFDVHRIKDGIPMYSKPMFMCLNCYMKLLRSQRIINNKEEK